MGSPIYSGSWMHATRTSWAEVQHVLWFHLCFDQCHFPCLVDKMWLFCSVGFLIKQGCINLWSILEQRGEVDTKIMEKPDRTYYLLAVWLLNFRELTTGP
jgi:hypothetical protein